jgi:hypothetical protein
MNSCDNEGELLPFLFPIHICYYYISLLYEIYYYLPINHFLIIGKCRFNIPFHSI